MLYVTEPFVEKQPIISKANEIGLKITQVPKEKLEKFAFNKPHQGVVLKTSPIFPTPISSPLEIPIANPQIWLCLDSITDPQNLGGIIRSAYFYHVDGILLPSKHSAPLSPAVAKVSCGALDWVTICSTSDLPLFLKDAKKCGWNISGAGNGQSARKLKEIKRTEKMMIVFGNEGEGIRERVKSECEDMYWIEGGRENVDSLNVGAAVSVFLYALGL